MNVSAHPEVLRLEDVGFAYPGEPALVSGWSASIGPGVTLLHGDTGSGKSTLLRVMAGALRCTGQLTLAGICLDDDPDAYRRQVFHCEPASEVFDQVTARACIAALGEGDVRVDESVLPDLIDGFALAAHIDKPMYMLSTGSKRKVWLAAALASGRALVLLDEPTGALDARSVAQLWAALAGRTRRANQAVVIASAERVPLAGVIELPWSLPGP